MAYSKFRLKVLPGLALSLLMAGAAAVSAQPHLQTDTQTHAPAHARKKTTAHGKPAAAASKHHASAHSTARATHKRGRAHVRHAKVRHAKRTARSIAQSKRLQRAFVASSQLRPMAQQLATNRTPAAYAGVTNYAQTHKGDAAAAAYLALGHAFLLDHRYPDAVSALTKANSAGDTLDGYADYLQAQAEMQAGQLPAAETLLTGFATRHPDSIFAGEVPVLIANMAIQQGDPQTAIRTLDQHANEAIAGHADYQLAMAKAQQMAGNTDSAAKGFRHLYLNYPLSPEAQQAKAQLLVIGAAAPLTVSERQRHADALYAAGRYSEAADEYRGLASDPQNTDPALKARLEVAAAACDYKLKRTSREKVEALSDTPDDSGARRSYLLVELARDRDDGDTQRALVGQMEQRFPTSPWLAEALYTSGNMYLLRKDYPHAIEFYGELAKRFPVICKGHPTTPCSDYAPSSHWRAAWLNYRIGQYSEAARLFDEQIAVYPGGKEIPGALYWRGRVYQDEESSPAKAAAYYLAVKNTYLHYFYAQVAAQHLTELGNITPAEMPQLDAIQPETVPPLTDDVPEDDPHVIRAKLLANAGLNEYISPEIQAAEGSNEWGAFAEAAIYTSYGETYKAMRVMKRALPFYTAAPLEAIPLAYWRILFPQAYWSQIVAESARNNLDPYMVASLIRQESEFNPAVISYADAYGLMQLLPNVGAELAKHEGIRHFNRDELLNPAINIRLGTRYLRQLLNNVGDRPEYAFAAYNAGENRVTDWKSIGNYRDIDEFVESIPFTQTRDYVQAIIRNEVIYRELAHPPAMPAPAAREAAGSKAAAAPAASRTAGTVHTAEIVH
ncbi:MAG: transglycosylase SLT domain-containing protein [Acidobacteriaceae bacterium]